MGKPNVKYKIGDVLECRGNLSGTVTETSLYSVRLDSHTWVPNSLVVKIVSRPGEKKS